MRPRYYRIGILLWLLAVACSNGQKSGGESTGPLPVDSVAVHFWDDAELLRAPVDSAAVEQQFADFLGLLYVVEPDTQAKAVAALMRGSSQQELISQYTEHYLYDPNSPLRSEELYILFVRQMIKIYRINVAERVLFQEKL